MNIFFKITKDLVNQFSIIVGDKSSLHVNEEFARRLRYRKPVVHGMLPFSFISFLQQEFPQKTICFNEITAKFKSPVFIGCEILLSVEYQEKEHDNYCFEAKWLDNNTETELISSEGIFTLISDNESEDFIEQQRNQECFVTDQLSENTYAINEIKDKEESFSFNIDKKLSVTYAKMLVKALERVNNPFELCYIDTNLISTLVTSTLVGMRLPGKYATFLDFKISYNERLENSKNYLMKGVVEKLYLSSGKIRSNISIASDNKIYATGITSVVINPLPEKTISCKEINAEYLDLGLKEKVVLITGASRGIGAATAKLFAMHGAKVVVNYFKGENDATSVVEDIRLEGGEAITWQCDIREKEQVRMMVSEVINHFGTIDILVNNAVKDFISKDILKLEWEDYLNELEVSLKGMHNCCKEVIPILKEKKQGKIIGLSSIFVDSPIKDQSKYIAAKSAIVGYIRSLAKDLTRYNIQANLVVPNMTETDLLSGIPASFVKKLGEERDYGRNLYPIEVAQSIVFLSSKWLDTMTGQKIVLNLGETPFL